MKHNDRLNQIIVVGNLVLAYLLVIAIVFFKLSDKIEDKFADLILMISSALAGFLSRNILDQFKPKPPAENQEQEGDPNGN